MVATKKAKSPGADREPEEAAASKFTPARIKEFTAEVQAEFKKIVWPTRKTTLASTGVVIFLVVLFSLYLGAVDLLLGKLVGYILQ